MAALSYRPLPHALAAAVGLASFVLVAAGMAAARPVHASTTIIVDTLADGHLDSGATTCRSATAGGRCALRAAVELADLQGAGGDVTITLGRVGTDQFQLSLGELAITRGMTIAGAGSASSAVLGDGHERVFHVSAAGAAVQLSGLAVRSGASAADGGGIRNTGSLTLTDVRVEGNDALIGGGIADYGTLRLNPGVVVTGNHALGMRGVGGGIAEFGTLTASAAVLSANTADVVGGNLMIDHPGVDQRTPEHGSATLTGTAITQGVAGFGGGIAVETGGTLTLTASTLSGNAARRPGGGIGGGIVNSCGTLQLTNDTLDGNVAQDGSGGAILNGCGGAALDFVTIAGNEAGRAGQPGVTTPIGAGIQVDGGRLTIHDSIVANGPREAGGKNCVVAAQATLVSLGYDLEDAGDCGFASTGDQTGKDPRLAALRNNGGPTATRALTAGSPAVDAADPRCDVSADQRGIVRPQGSRCDIGAFELEQPGPSSSAPPRPPVTGAAGSDPGAGVLAALLVMAALGGAGGAVLAWRRRRA